MSELAHQLQAHPKWAALYPLCGVPGIEHPDTQGWLMHALLEASDGRMDIAKRRGWQPRLQLAMWWEASVQLPDRVLMSCDATRGAVLTRLLLEAWAWAALQEKRTQPSGVPSSPSAELSAVAGTEPYHERAKRAAES